MVDLNDLVIFDPATSTLYSAKDLQMSMNGRALQITLPGMSMQSMPSEEPKKAKRKTTTYQKELGRQLARQNDLQRKKNGQLKKGRTTGSILSAAHKATKRALGTKKGQVRKTARRAFERK